MKRALLVAGAAAMFAAAGLVAVAQAPMDGGLIVNSGSTNARGYTLKVWSDGNSAAVVHPEQAMRMKISVGTDLTTKFLADAKAAKASADPGATTCMKSASFGYTLRVQYHGWTSADLACPVQSPTLNALKQDVQQIIAASKLPDLGPRRVQIPNDMRQVPPGGASSGPLHTMAPMPSSSPNPSPSSHP